MADISEITIPDGNTYTFKDKTARATADAAMPKSGGKMTGKLLLNADPTDDLGAVTKQYVDNKASGPTTVNFVLYTTHYSMFGIDQDANVSSSALYDAWKKGSHITVTDKVGDIHPVYDAHGDSETMYINYMQHGDGSGYSLTCYCIEGTTVTEESDDILNFDNLTEAFVATRASKTASKLDKTGAELYKAFQAGKTVYIVTNDSDGKPARVSLVTAITKESDGSYDITGTGDGSFLNITLDTNDYINEHTSRLITQYELDQFQENMGAALAGKLNTSGGTMTGTLTLAADPTADLQAATKQYVDSKTAPTPHYDATFTAVTEGQDYKINIPSGSWTWGILYTNLNSTINCYILSRGSDKVFWHRLGNWYIYSTRSDVTALDRFDVLSALSAKIEDQRTTEQIAFEYNSGSITVGSTDKSSYVYLNGTQTYFIYF